MTNAAQEPRRWTLKSQKHDGYGWEDEIFDGTELVHGETVEVVEASAYDALLAERDHGRFLLDNAQAARHEAAGMIDALKAELAALKEKAAKVHDALRENRPWTAEIRGVPQVRCGCCDWQWDHSESERHAPDCPAHPDFLTTSATESREAKGGTT